ncbi:hypothetical protein [Streptomyces sp. NPDC059371]
MAGDGVAGDGVAGDGVAGDGVTGGGVMVAALWWRRGDGAAVA